MALTIADAKPTAPDTWGRHRVRIVTVDFDSAYPTGGESLTPADVGLAEFDLVLISPDAGSAAGYIVQYDYVTQTLQVHVEEAVAAGGALPEVANGTDLSSLTVRVLCIGN